ncbi:TPA: NERD domain-containing protein [Staphylococcus pseudintermedius]|uniref:nuclease-related domain-containing protein n=1 Tax=Staphylococcus pseudintermedius TaxID=283734 RepID=UPI0019E704ED|nr:nuclease-related domain-containing protein [Staphylococcus pseudintermedius]EGQ0325415.1 NERD domain-containing protein [Staphylococcus pseudintermedius]EGQ1294540.1 hypothetical protein [Staphylococcus pseudintermedius]EGQ3135143.1 NERD domain-containing protein [Staphylococcus pseudintermedius]EGQ3276030.1 NERD domain-containing protein [Staphylococcus pseudintermedius]EGQ3321375.1 NERD domain-containing protein [Staphylococcus pseudintermedius]
MVIVIIILMITILGLVFVLKRTNAMVKEEMHKRMAIEQQYEKKLEQKETEVDTHIQTLESYQLSKGEIETDFKQLEKDYIQLKETLNKHKIFSNNIGEVMASRDLSHIFESYKSRGIVNQYHIIDNILFSDENVRQIDHVVVCDYGIFMIETKTWKGDIFYNTNKEALQGTAYRFLEKYLFNDKFEKAYKTFVLKSDKDGKFEVLDYGNPYQQVRQSIYKVYHYFNKKYYVNGLVYFNYKAEADHYIFFDGSEENNPIKAVNQIEHLVAYFDDKIKNSKKYMNADDINAVATKLKENMML